MNPLTQLTLVDNFGQVYKVESDVITIGSDPTNDIVLDDSGFSKGQVDIKYSSEGWTLENLDINHPFKINDKEVSGPVKISNNDIISIGESIFKVVINADELRPGPQGSSASNLEGLSSFRAAEPALTDSPGEQTRSKQKKCRACQRSIHVEAEICPHCGVRQFTPSNVGTQGAGGKNKVTAALLAILLGGLGAHKFYLGSPIAGLLYLFFSWTFIPAIVGLIEGVTYLGMSDENFSKKYNK